MSKRLWRLNTVSTFFAFFDFCPIPQLFLIELSPILLVEKYASLECVLIDTLYVLIVSRNHRKVEVEVILEVA